MTAAESADRSNQPDLLRVCRIGRAQGLKGEVNVYSYTDEPEVRFAPGSQLRTQDGTVFTVRSSRRFKLRWILRFESVSDRTAAERLNGTTLYVSRAEQEQSDDADDDDDDGIYLEDLIGLKAVLADGTELGEVTDAQDGAQVLLSVTEPKGHVSLVPYVEAIVPDVDLEAGTITLDPPAGLLQEH